MAYQRLYSSGEIPKVGGYKPLYAGVSGTQNIQPKAPQVLQTMNGKPSMVLKPVANTDILKPVVKQENKWPLGFVGQMAKKAYETTRDTIDNATRKLVDMIDAAGKYNLKDAEKIQEQYGKGIPTGAISTEEAAQRAGVKPVSKLERGVSMVSGASSAADMWFLQYSVPLEAGAELPGVLAFPSKFVKSFLGDVGRLGSYTLGKGVEILPVSQESKNTMMPLAEELGALVTQLGIAHTGAKFVKGKDLKPWELPSKKIQATQLGLGYAMNPFKTIYSLTSSRIATKIAERQKAGEEITPEVGKQVIEEVKQEIQEQGLPPVEELLKPETEAPKVEVSKPEVITKAEVAKLKPFEVDIKDLKIEPFDRNLALEDVGTKNATQTNLPVLVVKNADGSLGILDGNGRVINAETAGKTKIKVTTDEKLYRELSAKAEGLAPQEAPVSPKTAPTSEISPEVGKVSGVAKSIEAKAIEDKLTKGIKDLAEYDARSFKEEAKKVADLINKDIDRARRIVRGEETSNRRAGALIAGMEEYAKAHPKEAADIIQELANSPLASQISVGASETSFARMRAKESAAYQLSEVKKTYEAKVKDLPQKKTKLKEDLKKETEKFNLSKEERSFNKFLDKITC